ncbi:MAG: hypothetical protein ACKOC0_09130 [Cytophagales bacterium]
MLQNILKTALRVLYKNKSYALINFVGLTIGLTLVLLQPGVNDEDGLL